MKSLADPHSYSVSVGLLDLYLPQSYRSESWSEPEASLPISKEPEPSLSGNEGAGMEERSSKHRFGLNVT